MFQHSRDGHDMATKDCDWPGHTQWFCCPTCTRLWTYQGKEIVALDSQVALGPAQPSEGVPRRSCAVCEGERSAPVAEI